MERFPIVKKGYSPQAVDEYIDTLEQVIRSYKDKDNAIKNAIISAQVAAENILKNTHMEAAAYKTKALSKLKQIHDSIGVQRTRLQAFQEDYDVVLRKYLNNFEESDMARIRSGIDELEGFFRDISMSIENRGEASEETPKQG